MRCTIRCLVLVLIAACTCLVASAQEMTITITNTASVQADAAGHNLQMANGYVLNFPSLELALLCDDAQRTCLPLRSGQTYPWKEIHLGDEGYAYGYAVKGPDTKVIRIAAKDKGKEVPLVYLASPKKNCE
jgi:hypothetical protein